MTWVYDRLRAERCAADQNIALWEYELLSTPEWLITDGTWRQERHVITEEEEPW